MSTPGPNSAGPAAVKSAGSTNLIDVVIEDADADSDGLKRTIGPLNLTSIGVAAVIGAGIFVVTGRAAAENAGPAVIISFIIAGIVATLSALCYAELASMIPLAGSTYSYAYAAMGTLVAWIIGWDLLVEYLFGAANVASGWSGYFTSMLKGFGLELPVALTTPTVADGAKEGGILNVPAMILIALITLVLYRRTAVSWRHNRVRGNQTRNARTLRRRRNHCAQLGQLHPVCTPERGHLQRLRLDRRDRRSRDRLLQLYFVRRGVYRRARGQTPTSNRANRSAWITRNRDRSLRPRWIRPGWTRVVHVA